MHFFLLQYYNFSSEISILSQSFASHPDSHERVGASNICVSFRGTEQMVWSGMLSITRKLAMISSQETIVCTLCTTVLVLKIISVTNVFSEPKINQIALMETG